MRLVIPKDISEKIPHNDENTNHTEHQEAPELITEIQKKAFYRIASLQERAAAFCVDMLINLVLFFALSVALQYFLKGNPSQPFRFQGNGWFVFATSAMAVHFLYFFFFEGIVTATPGKLFTGLSIQKKNGQTPSLFSILVRNIFRLVDYPFFFLTGLGMAESSHRRQRLGDWVAGTVVACLPPGDNRRVHPSSIKLSGTIRRVIAFVMDATLVIATFYGILFLIPTNRRLVSLILLNSLPFFLVSYLALSETFFQTTFGKVILGMKVVREDGRSARLGTVLIRNAFKIFDLNPLNYLAMSISSYKQKLGDSISGTVVVNDRKGFWGWLSIPFMLVIPAVLLFFGLQQKNNFWKTDRVISVGYGKYRATIDPIPAVVKTQLFGNVTIQSIDLGLSGTNDDPQKIMDRFVPGDLVFVHLQFLPPNLDSKNSPIPITCEVFDANNVSILKIENTQLLPIQFVLHPQAVIGEYTIKITSQDRLGSTSTIEKKFSVSPVGLSVM